MFNYIDQTNRADFECDIASLFTHKGKSTSRIEQSVYDHDKTVYITYNDPNTGLAAGARLAPMTSKNLTSDTLKTYVKGFEAQGFWECSYMVFHLEEAHPIHDDPKALNSLYAQYYESFREAISTTCLSFHIESLLFLAPESTIEKLQHFGKMAFKPKLSIDDRLSIALFKNPHRH